MTNEPLRPGQIVYWNDPDDPTQSDYAFVMTVMSDNQVRIRTNYNRVVWKRQSTISRKHRPETVLR